MFGILRASILDNLFPLLIGWRILNALTLRTFFQPDEFYQALEPAWWMAFGQDQSHAWITWEWKNHLRSASHPAIFAVVYRFADILANTLSLGPDTRANVLLAAPKCVQAFLAAVTDYYTYKLSAQIHGPTSDAAWMTILLTVGSAWNWFVSTRTFSNCLETTLTTIALYNWPYHWSLGVDETGFQADSSMLRMRKSSPEETGEFRAKEQDDTDETTRLRRCILAASLAVLLRPTNVMIWLTLITTTFGRGIWQFSMQWEIDAFVRQGLLCGSTILALTAVIDRLFYGVWTFPVWHFFKINVLQSVAVFYGNSNWHYYLTQGYPLMLTAALPYAMLGMYSILSRSAYFASLPVQSQAITYRLALVSVVLPFCLSLLSHKEVRFIYPVLPALHILAATRLCRSSGEQVSRKSPRSEGAVFPRGIRPAVVILLVVNVFIAGYVSVFHNSGIMTIPTYLRTEFETRYSASLEAHSASAAQIGQNLTFAVLTPCHSIPWRSHMQHSPTEVSAGISGWALTCEPPLNLNVTEKQSYLDEADVFYLNPAAWLKANMALTIPAGVRKPGAYAAEQKKNHYSSPHRPRGVWLNEGQGVEFERSSMTKAKPQRAWPDYLLFFGHLEPFIIAFLGDSGYAECARLFNSHFHDDWRRTGNIIVWCLHTEQHDRRPNSSHREL